MKCALKSNYKIIHPSIREELNEFNNSDLIKLFAKREFNFGLSEAEIKIIKYIQLPERLSTKEIAAKMNYTYDTVKNLVSNIYKNLGFVTKDGMSQKQQLISWANVNLIGYDYLIK